MSAMGQARPCAPRYLFAGGAHQERSPRSCGPTIFRIPRATDVSSDVTIACSLMLGTRVKVGPSTLGGQRARSVEVVVQDELVADRAAQAQLDRPLAVHLEHEPEAVLARRCARRRGDGCYRVG